ncbi:hypothetical protein CEXT_681651, partial [Caerostris extrusa]
MSTDRGLLPDHSQKEPHTCCYTTIIVLT